MIGIENCFIVILMCSFSNSKLSECLLQNNLAGTTIDIEDIMQEFLLSITIHVKIERHENFSSSFQYEQLSQNSRNFHRATNCQNC